MHFSKDRTLWNNKQKQAVTIERERSIKRVLSSDMHVSIRLKYIRFNIISKYGIEFVVANALSPSSKIK